MICQCYYLWNETINTNTTYQSKRTTNKIQDKTNPVIMSRRKLCTIIDVEKNTPEKRLKKFTIQVQIKAIACLFLMLWCRSGVALPPWIRIKNTTIRMRDHRWWNFVLKLTRLVPRKTCWLLRLQSASMSELMCEAVAVCAATPAAARSCGWVGFLLVKFVSKQRGC